MNLRLALRLLWRDWRAGELTLLVASLVIAVGTVTTITLFVSRLDQALLRDSSSFLAADRVIRSDIPVSANLLDQAKQMGIREARTLSFLSMVFAGSRSALCSVKAVSDRYPLRGQLTVSEKPFVTPGEAISHVPAPGHVWVESRLLPSLHIAVGAKVQIGVATFVVSKVLVKEPDAEVGFSAVGPRVMMNIADVPKTQVVQPASRVTWRYLFASDSTALLNRFERWARPRLEAGARMYGIKQGVTSIGNALDRAERFLLLGGLLGVILAGVAIALSAQRYALRHYDHVAILKTLGATPNGIDVAFLVIFVVIGAVGTLGGTALGYTVQAGIVAILSPWLPVTLPGPGLRPIWFGMVTGFVCLLSFALPPLMRLRSVEPVRVFRRDLAVPGVRQRMTYGAAILGTLGLMWWYSEDLYLTLLIFSGALVAGLILAVIAWGMLQTGRVLGMQAGSAWRLALAGMQKRGRENILQILAFGLAIMLLLILFLVRTALIDQWRAQIPTGAANHFAINIAPAEVAPIERLFARNGVSSAPLFPMIRGRIERIDGQPVKQHEHLRRERGERASAARGPRAGSGRNLTWTAQLPEGNRIVAGNWWPAGYQGPPLVSLEQDFARANGIAVGDQLKFSIEGETIDARVASLRSVSWDDLRPNFFVIFSPGALADFPSTYMTSFHLPATKTLVLNELLRAHPTITVISVDALIARIKTIIAQVTSAIELVLGLILVSGALVLLASLRASMDERFRQQAILRTLGASRRLVLGSLLIEFCALGCFAGLLATIGAEVTVFALERNIFHLPYHATPQLWLIGPIVGTLLIGSIGTLATRKVVRVAPITVLRDL